MVDGPIILFDAECVLCSANARFVLRHDKAARFRLASIQGVAGAALSREHGLDPRDPTSILVVDGVHLRRDSDAVITIYEGLGWPWRLLSFFRLVPAFLRNPAYRWIARNRYRLFGKRTTCWVAPSEYQNRILG
jgi:predicted DCC family thiol-disulfide oxidoreductase YuxK